MPGIGDDSDDNVSSLGTASYHSGAEHGDEPQSLMNKFNTKVMAKYKKALLASSKEADFDEDSDVSEKAKGVRMIKSDHLDEICAIYKESLDTVIDNKYLAQLFDSEYIEEVGEVINALTLDHVDNEKAEINKAK